MSSQEISDYKEIVKTLSSDEFAGRGYVENGIDKAADFISEAYKKRGLMQFNSNYKQNFTISVNTFPSKTDITINNTTLIPGKDFLINAASASLSGTFKVKYFHYSEFLTGLDLRKVKIKKE